MFSTENHDDHGDTHGNGTGSVVLNGTVTAGIHNQAVITIGLDGTLTPTSGGSPYALGLELVADPSLLNPVVSYNHQKIQYAIVNGFNPHTDVVAQIASLSGLTTAQVETALTGGTANYGGQ